MPTDAELTYADHAGRFYARHYGFPPMAGRLIGYLSVCEPPAQSIAELAEALLASRSAIAGAVKMLEDLTHTIIRTRVAGERMDRVQIDLGSPQAMGFDTSEYEELHALALEGLEVIRDKPAERQAVLREAAAFAEFVNEQVGQMKGEWARRRAEMVAAGELPEQPARRGR